MDASVTRAGFTLVPEKDVLIQDGRFVATSDEPWLRIEGDFGARPFVEIAFRASLLDDPVRPVLRFSTKTGPLDRILPGPVAGAGIWRGALPKGVRAVSISPTNRPGRFDFTIESIRPVGLGEMLASTWRRKPAKLWSYFLPTLFGFSAEAENALDWVNNSEPVEAFETFLARRERRFEPDGIDAPRSDCSAGPLIAIVIFAESAASDALTRTLDSLRAQIYPLLRVIIVDASDETRALVAARNDERFVVAGAALPAGADFLCRLQPGDELSRHALTCLAEASARAPQARLFYADEIIRTPCGRRPSFKPGWSPIFESTRPYLGRCVFVATAALASSDWPDDATLDHAIHAAALRLDPDSVVPLRRWLLTRDDDAAAALPAVPPTPLSPPPSASIILLTRDKPELLGPCLDSVLRLSTHTDFELIVIDNGSRRADTFAILDKAATDKRVRVLKRPEPFNFARFNNEAVAETRGEVLVFLNNDTILLSPDWLEQLTRPALDTAAGAIGALLTFPDGRVQHAGVVVGIGQDAGHFGALVPPEAPSWLDRTRHVHETAAVTAACMAVERRKFEAVGGFDAVHLPIEFNDTDLCLRLAERGWISRYVPSVRLVHLESASRGSAMFRPMSVYAKERDYFRERWRKVLRDDPFHHPGLSLYARREALW